MKDPRWNASERFHQGKLLLSSCPAHGLAAARSRACPEEPPLSSWTAAVELDGSCHCIGQCCCLDPAFRPTPSGAAAVQARGDEDDHSEL